MKSFLYVLLGILLFGHLISLKAFITLSLNIYILKMFSKCSLYIFRHFSSDDWFSTMLHTHANPEFHEANSPNPRTNIKWTPPMPLYTRGEGAFWEPWGDGCLQRVSEKVNSDPSRFSQTPQESLSLSSFKYIQFAYTLKSSSVLKLLPGQWNANSNFW